MNKFRIKKMNIEDFRLVYGRFCNGHPDYELFKNEEVDYYLVYLNEEYEDTFNINITKDNQLSISYKLFANNDFIEAFCDNIKTYPYISYSLFSEEQKQYLNRLLKYVDIIKESTEINDNLTYINKIIFKIKNN